MSRTSQEFHTDAILRRLTNAVIDTFIRRFSKSTTAKEQEEEIKKALDIAAAEINNKIETLELLLSEANEQLEMYE